MIDDKLTPSDADRAEAHGAHRRLYSVTSGGHEVLCRGPKRVEWKRFLDAVSADPGKRYGASITLFTQCLVWPKARSPEAKELDEVFEDTPVVETAFALSFAGEVQAGFEGEAKKAEAGSS